MNTTTTPSAKPIKTAPVPAVKKAAAPVQNAVPLARKCASKEAKRRAAAILEVLAGIRTPPDAAQVLGVTVPRYYLLEQRGLDALVTACEPRTQGLQPSPERELARLRKELERSQRDCARQQALVRLAQRTVGLAAPPTDPAKSANKNGKRKPRRPVVRALKVAARLQLEDSGQDAHLTPTTNGESTAEGASTAVTI
jgi:hypothetical protein